jgi:hypothetical protein
LWGWDLAFHVANGLLFLFFNSLLRPPLYITVHFASARLWRHDAAKLDFSNISCHLTFGRFFPKHTATHFLSLVSLFLSRRPSYFSSTLSFFLFNHITLGAQNSVGISETISENELEKLIESKLWILQTQFGAPAVY